LLDISLRRATIFSAFSYHPATDEVRQKRQDGIDEIAFPGVARDDGMRHPHGIAQCAVQIAKLRPQRIAGVPAAQFLDLKIKIKIKMRKERRIERRLGNYS